MEKKFADGLLIDSCPMRVARQLRQSFAVTAGDFQKPLKVFRPFRPPLYGQEVDDLNEKFSVSLARVANGFDKLLQTRQESIVTDPKQRTAGNIANAGSFDDERRRLSFSKSSIPIEIVLRDKAVCGRAPRHHRRHPTAAGKIQIAKINWLKRRDGVGFFSGGQPGSGIKWFVRFHNFPLEEETLH